MKVAVLSDIHSNYHAFEACFRDATMHSVERFIFLGDYVSDLAEPRKTMDLVYKIQSGYPAVCLRGNREGYMLACEAGELTFTRGSRTGSLMFTYEHLSAQDLAFFRELKSYDIVELEGLKMEIAHAAPGDDRCYFEGGDSSIAGIFAKMTCQYLLTGHSHKQYMQNDSGKTIINPGSVGIPQDGSLWPKYAILDIVGGELSCLFREVPYDIGKAIHAQYENGLVDYARYWAIGIAYDLITGRECVLKLLKKVLNGNAAPDEEAWHSAAVQLGMKFAEQEIMEAYDLSADGQ